MFFPVTLLGMYSPFAIRLLLRSPLRSGRVSGTVYARLHRGIDRRNLGHDLLPHPGHRLARDHADARRSRHRQRHLSCCCTRRFGATRVRSPASACWRPSLLTAPTSRADSVIDDATRAAMLKRADGRIAHIETEYNDIFITKRGTQLTMSFQLKGWDYTESVVNLADPDDLPLPLHAGDDGGAGLSGDAEDASS